MTLSGHTLDTAGRYEPIWLDEPGACWTVESGSADVFLVRLLGPRSPGSRTHLFRVEAGAALFGMDRLEGDSKWGVIAQPGVDASVIRKERNEGQFDVAVLENWMIALTRAAASEAEPKQYLPLSISEVVDVPRDPLPLCGTEDLVWVRHLRGVGHFLGDARLVVSGDVPFPLARPAWLGEQAKNLVVGTSTSEMVAEGKAWSGLDRLHRIAFGALVQHREETEARERKRLETRQEQDKKRLSVAVSRLGSVLSTAREKETSLEAEHPLVLACKAIGEAQQIPFQTPPEVLRGLPMVDPVRSICRSSGVRYRRVVLEESWYRKESLPLLGLREGDQSPVALLPTPAGFEIYDPLEGTGKKVTATIAATLQPFAYSFYRPFHAKPVTLKYLCLFGLSGAWREVIYVLAIGLIGGLMGMVTPLVTETLFDVIIPGAQRQRLVETALFLFSATLAGALLSLSRSFTMMRLENKVEAKVQAAIFDRLLSLPAPFFRKYTAGELAHRAAAINSIRQMLTNSATSALFSAIFGVFNFVLLFRYSSQLTMVALGLTAVQLLVYLGTSFLQYQSQKRLIDIDNKSAGLMLQLIAGISKFRVSGTENRAFAVWAKSIAESGSYTIRSARLSNSIGVFNGAFSLVSSMIVFYVTGKLMEDPATSGLTTGSFAAFSSAFGSFSGALMQMAQVGMGLMAIGPIYKNAKPILEAVPESDASAPRAMDLSGRLELSHVNFRYREDGPLVLKDVSCSVEPGQFVAFVGASGSGKSTLVRLLLGFEKPESGAIQFDGQDLNTLDVVSVRQQMGVVLQNSTLFGGDIFQNIVCSAPYTLDEAWEAVRLAGMEADLKAMPMGLHTIVGEGGAGLSGGQRQRLMIARAIVGKPRMLIFDEATSALDNQTQAIVSSSLEKMRSTRVVIAHRLTTVMKADRIFVVDQGEIVQAGTYEELMAQPGVFAELAKRQLK